LKTLYLTTNLFYLIIQKGDCLYFVNGDKARVVDIKESVYFLMPFYANQNLGSGCGSIHPFKLEEIPEVCAYGGIKRPYYGV